MSAQDNAKLAQSFYDMFNKGDIDGMVAQAAENVEVISMANGMTLHGPEGMRQYTQGWASAFPDAKVEVTNIVAGEDSVVVEFRGRGTHTGPLVGPQGEIPPTGKAVGLRRSLARAANEVIGIRNRVFGVQSVNHLPSKNPVSTPISPVFHPERMMPEC